MHGLSRGQQQVEFGEYGLKALEAGWLTNRQIEAARIAMTRKIKRGGKVWINVFPDKPFTKKPAETRMGSGKGNPEGWVAVVEARPRDVRARRRAGAARPRGHAPRRPQAARQDQVRAARGRPVMKARDLRDLPDDKLREHIATSRRDVFGLRLQHATGELENTAGLRASKRDLARALTVARQRGVDPTVTTTAETNDG